MELVGHKSINLWSYYHPKTSNEESNHQLAKSLERASSIKNSFIVVAGDFHLPGWDWKYNRLKPNTPYPLIHHKFIDISDDNGFIQILEEPTRDINTLDLIATNHPSSFRTEIIPEVSDDDIVYTEIDIVQQGNNKSHARFPNTAKQNRKMWSVI